MRRRWLWVALATSVALNILLGAYVVGGHWHHPGRPGGSGGIAKELKFTPEQRAAYERYKQAAEEGRRRFRQEARPLIQQSWREIAKPELNQAELDRLFEESTEKRRGLQRETVRSMREFFQTLDPEQRTRFVEYLRERMERPPERRDRGGVP
jgi:Spy/CpxP family protein refolding chaperone